MPRDRGAGPDQSRPFSLPPAADFAATRRGGPGCLAPAGFSLLEMLVCTALSTLLLVGFLGLVGLLQAWSADLNLALERDQNLWLSPLLLTRWVLHAGNNRWQEEWAGIGLEGEALDLKSDIDGPEGFPDGRLGDSFERLTIRAPGSELQLRSGDGGFQPLLRHIHRFVPDLSLLPLLAIDLEAVTERPLATLPEESRGPARLLFLLRTYRPNLFPERPR